MAVYISIDGLKRYSPLRWHHQAQHQFRECAAYAFMEEAIAACAYGGSVKLMSMVVASFLRLVTNSKIFVRPTPVEDAVGFLETRFAVPGVEMPPLGTEWPMLRQLCIE